jgi:hypothetical protein
MSTKSHIFGTAEFKQTTTNNAYLSCLQIGKPTQALRATKSYTLSLHNTLEMLSIKFGTAEYKQTKTDCYPLQRPLASRPVRRAVCAQMLTFTQSKTLGLDYVVQESQRKQKVPMTKDNIDKICD